MLLPLKLTSLASRDGLGSQLNAVLAELPHRGYGPRPPPESAGEANGVITFAWEGWSVAGSWGATGTIRGDRLTVQYNLIMQLTDFEDAVYARMP